jgi:hypothetical protein
MRAKIARELPEVWRNGASVAADVGIGRWHHDAGGYVAAGGGIYQAEAEDDHDDEHKNEEDNTPHDGNETSFGGHGTPCPYDLTGIHYTGVGFKLR